MTNQVPWNKIILEEFINLALLTKDEEMILRTRIYGWTVREQADKLNMSISSVRRTAINALKTNDTNIEGTEIDDNIALMNSHFRRYIEAKKEYRKDNNEIDKRNSIRELEAFLSAMYGILEEMKTSSDFQEEREMVRDKLREMFSVYQ